MVKKAYLETKKINGKTYIRDCNGNLLETIERRNESSFQDNGNINGFQASGFNNQVICNNCYDLVMKGSENRHICFLSRPTPCKIKLTEPLTFIERKRRRTPKNEFLPDIRACTECGLIISDEENRKWHIRACKKNKKNFLPDKFGN